RVCSGRVRDPGGFFLSQRGRPVSRYRELASAVVIRGGESKIAENVAKTDIEPMGKGFKPRVQRLAGQRRQADGEGPRKRHGVAGVLRPLPGWAVIFRDSRVSSSSGRAFSAAASFLTRSISSWPSRSAPVRTARWHPRLINVMSEPMCPVERANR